MTFVNLQVPAIDNYKAPLSPEWSFESLASALHSVEEKLRAASPYPTELKLGSVVKSPPPPSPPAHSAPVGRPDRSLSVQRRDAAGSAPHKPFAVRAPLFDEDEEDEASDGNTSPESSDRELVTTGTRFSCADLYLSDSDNSEESDAATESRNLMRRTSLEEGLLLDMERENKRLMREEVRKRVSRLEDEIRNINEKTASSLLQIEKNAQARREMDKRLDNQYRQKIAEEINHRLSIIQRNHAQKSHAEELKIRNDALEETQRKEKALLEEKLREEKARVEAEARLEAERRDEEARRLALEAERKALEEASVNEKTNSTNLSVQQRDAIEKDMGSNQEVKKSTISSGTSIQKNERKELAGIKVKAASSAIEAAENRLKKFNDVSEHFAQLPVNLNKELENCERQILKRIKQITGTVENVRLKANELVTIMKNPRYPQFISVMMFAKKIVSLCENPSGGFESTAFACSHVILIVASQVPAAMDLLLAEFHNVCIYTVPKHIQASASFQKTREYWKMLGYREENGKTETSDRYLERIEAYMKLYGALIQTETPGIQNPHGLKEGWAWLARFLNELPAAAATATALQAFLKMTGFALHRKYKSQFRKILTVISSSFVPALKVQENPKLNPVISNLEGYIGKQEFLREPEGWQLRTHLSSRDFV